MTKRRVGLLALWLLVGLALTAVLWVSLTQAQDRILGWWSMPYGDQVTCGGPEFTQTHFYEWSGERPEWVDIQIVGPHTYDYQNGVFIPHYRVINVFPAVWEWDVVGGTPGCGEDYRECWIRGKLKDSMWVDEDRHTVPIGYTIQLHYLRPGFNDGADHYMGAWYGQEYFQDNAGRGMYDARGCVEPYGVYLPLMLR